MSATVTAASHCTVDIAIIIDTMGSQGKEIVVKNSPYTHNSTNLHCKAVQAATVILGLTLFVAVIFRFEAFDFIHAYLNSSWYILYEIKA